MYAFVWFFLLKIIIFFILEGILIRTLIKRQIKFISFLVITGLFIVIGLTLIFPQYMILATMYIGILIAVCICISINSVAGRFIWATLSVCVLLYASVMLLFSGNTSNYYSYRVFYDENQEKYTVVELASRFSQFAVEGVTINYYIYKGYEIFPSETYQDFDKSFEYRREIPDTYEDFQRSIEYMEKL